MAIPVKAGTEVGESAEALTVVNPSVFIPADFLPVAQSPDHVAGTIVANGEVWPRQADLVRSKDGD